MAKGPRRTNLPSPRFCIFGDHRRPGNRMSGEHLYSDWMKELLPKSAEYTEEEDDYYSLRSPFVGKSKRFRVGRATAKKIKVVCQECNSTWMSKLETEARPYLTPLILGQFVALNAAAKTNVVRWLILKALILESERKFGKEPNPLYNQADREAFMATGQLPFGFRIWLGRGDGPAWETKMVFMPATLRIEPKGTTVENFDPAGPPTNIESIARGIGRLRVYMLATTDRKMFEGLRWQFSNLVPVWPLVGNDIIWPAPGMEPKSDDEMEALALLLRKVVDDAQASHAALFGLGL